MFLPKWERHYLAPLQNFACQSIEESDNLSSIHKQNMSEEWFFSGRNWNLHTLWHKYVPEKSPEHKMCRLKRQVQNLWKFFWISRLEKGLRMRPWYWKRSRRSPTDRIAFPIAWKSHQWCGPKSQELYSGIALLGLIQALQQPWFRIGVLNVFPRPESKWVSNLEFKPRSDST